MSRPSEEKTIPNPSERPRNAPTVSDATIAAEQVTSVEAVSAPLSFADPAEGSRPQVHLEGFDVIRQFEARGGEADIFLVGSATGNNVLKLYRYGINPKFEILQRMVALSRENPRCFVQIHYFGYHPESQRFFELQEFIPGGTLGDIMDGQPLPEIYIREFLVRMTEILTILHQHEILHLDLKPGNILLRSRDPLEIVLTDFGIASILEEEFSKKMTEVKGTSLYQSPESLSGVVSKKSDWWSLGIMLLEMLAGSHPFAQLNRQVVFFQLAVKGIPIPENLPGKWKALLRGLLLRNPEQRWSGREVQGWLAGEFTAPPPDENPDGIGEIQAADATANRPFDFMGVSYVALPTLLGAFASTPEGWAQGKVQVLKRYVLSWLEERRMFEQAGRLAVILDEEIDPDLALFRIIYTSYGDLPLYWQGIPVSAGKIAGILPEILEGTCPPLEQQFLDSLCKKQVLPLHEALTGQPDWKNAPLLFFIGNLQQSALHLASLKERVRALLLALDSRLREHHPVDLLNLAMDGDAYGQTAYSVISLLGFIDFAVKCGVFSYQEAQAWRFCAHLFDHLQISLPYRQIFRRFGREIVHDITSDGSLQEMVFLVMNAPEINEENVKAFQLIRNKHPWILDMLRVRFKLSPTADMGKFLEMHLLHFRAREKREVLEKKVLPPFMQEILRGPNLPARFAFLIRRLSENPHLLPDRRKFRLPGEAGKLFLIDQWADIEAGLPMGEGKELHFSSPESFAFLLEYLTLQEKIFKFRETTTAAPEQNAALAVFAAFTFGILLSAPYWLPLWLLFGFWYFRATPEAVRGRALPGLEREAAAAETRLREEAGKPWKKFKD